MADSRVLIVEDEGIVARDIQDCLIGLGYEVSGIASSGAEALERVADRRPDLVLMDIVLEGDMDGVEAAELIRNRFTIPVVYLTAYADDDTLQRAKVTEPYGYVLKPFEERELHTVIEIALYKHAMERKLKEEEERRKKLEARIQYAQRQESLIMMASGVVQDFNNLLSVILGNADLALLELPPESIARDRIEQIEMAIIRGMELTNQMLAYSGSSPGAPKEMSLSELILGMDHLLDAIISGKTVLSYSLASDLPMLKADISQMKQMVVNLISNASEAIGDRSGLITVSTGVLEMAPPCPVDAVYGEAIPEGTYLYIEVSDTGSGVAPEQMRKIFEPFFSTKLLGRGMGLAAVQGIVEKHGGAIQVTSVPQQGTTFRVLFPCTEKPGQQLNVESRKVEAWRSNGTILIVDKEEGSRGAAKDTLRRFGMTVLTARNEDEALKIFHDHEQEISLVVLDMTLPYMHSREVLHEINRMQPETPVILTSRYADEEAIKKYAARETAGFLHKPYRPLELIEKVRKGLEVSPS